MSRSLFLIITSLYPATSLKERTPKQMFSDEFFEIPKTPFLQNTSMRLLLFYGKIFHQQYGKEPSEKRKKLKQLVRKTTAHAKQKLNHYLHEVFILFYYSKISLLFFSLFPPYIETLHSDDWKHEFLETMQSHWGFIYYRKLFLTFGLKKKSFYDRFLFIRL